MKNKIENSVYLFQEAQEFQNKLFLMKNHLEKLIETQKNNIKKKNPDFSWLKGRCDPSLLVTKSFVEDLLKIDWQKYNIDQGESFVEEMGEPIGEGGFLRICIKHTDKSIKTYNQKKEKEDIFIEIVLTEEAIITYPGGHSHGDYYDYSTGEYIQNNETIELIKNILEENLVIKYVFRGNDLIGSGIRESQNQRFWMTYGVTFEYLNPMYWLRKFLGKFEKESEEIITINWKK